MKIRIKTTFKISLLFVLLLILSLFPIKMNVAAADYATEGYLSNLRVVINKGKDPSILENFNSNIYDYTIFIPSDTLTLKVGAMLSDSAPQESTRKVNYVWKLNGYTQDYWLDIETSTDMPNLVTTCSNMLTSEDEGTIFKVVVGIEGNSQTYIVYVQRENTPAANLTTQLNALPEVSSLTVTDKEAVTSAKEAYEALTDEQKSYMQPSLIQKLTDAEEKIAELEKEAADQEAAGKVIDEIKAVNPETATLEELKKVQVDYDALTAEQKAIVDADATAVAAKKAIDKKANELEKAEVDQKAADEVIKAIKAIDPAKASKEELEKVQAAYDALTAEQKAIVDADPAAVSAKKAIDAKVVELNKPAEQPTEEKPTESKPADTKPVADKTVSVKKGATFTVKGYKYKVTSNLVKNPTVTVTGYKNKKLSKITVPATVTYKKVKFKVTAVSANAFKGQKKAKTAYLGSNVKSIGSKAFYGDGKIKKITVKSSVLTKVGSKAYKGIAKKAVIKVPSKKLKAYKKLMKGKGQAETVKITK